MYKFQVNKYGIFATDLENLLFRSLSVFYMSFLLIRPFYMVFHVDNYTANEYNEGNKTNLGARKVRKLGCTQRAAVGVSAAAQIFLNGLARVA